MDERPRPTSWPRTVCSRIQHVIDENVEGSIKRKAPQHLCQASQIEGPTNFFFLSFHKRALQFSLMALNLAFLSPRFFTQDVCVTC